MTPQELQLELMKLSRFNEFDGPSIVKSLLANHDLWEACYFARLEGGELITLRDMSQGIYNTDTLWILANPGKEEDLRILAKTWQADEINYISKDGLAANLGSYPATRSVLRVWWD